jgi:hypothetical protein
MTPQQHLGVAKLFARCDTIPAQQRITPTTRCHKTAARASRNIIILYWTTSDPPKLKLNGTKPRVGNDSGTSSANDVPHRPHDSAAPERRKRIVVQKTRIELRARVRRTIPSNTRRYYDPEREKIWDIEKNGAVIDIAPKRFPCSMRQYNGTAADDPRNPQPQRRSALAKCRIIVTQSTRGRNNPVLREHANRCCNHKHRPTQHYIENVTKTPRNPPAQRRGALLVHKW